ncbi:hypothetical protein [Wukongibacter sp. M2B1]|uniref:hypothetical protein n=1 Tax=Wukongibacter sp. M2B1 TaxID=3088895 RepID=UPI003D7AB1CD
MTTEIAHGDRFEASAVCQKIVGLFGQQALTAFSAQILSLYEAQFAIADDEEDDKIFV